MHTLSVDFHTQIMLFTPEIDQSAETEFQKVIMRTEVLLCDTDPLSYSNAYCDREEIITSTMDDISTDKGSCIECFV